MLFLQETGPPTLNLWQSGALPPPRLKLLPVLLHSEVVLPQAEWLLPPDSKLPLPLGRLLPPEPWERLLPLGVVLPQAEWLLPPDSKLPLPLGRLLPPAPLPLQVGLFSPEPQKQ